MAAVKDAQQDAKKAVAEVKKADAKQGNWFSRLFKRIGKAFYNMYHELKKVTWPTKNALIDYSLVVLAFLVIMGVLIGLFDMGASALIQLITGSAGA
ncbi:MAG: preprotein translocase subunit SecE [Clostridia bacterium]|nr:preprotein translocase subunit SecE [Clostridia bacterium]